MNTLYEKFNKSSQQRLSYILRLNESRCRRSFLRVFTMTTIYVTHWWHFNVEQWQWWLMSDCWSLLWFSRFIVTGWKCQRVSHENFLLMVFVCVCVCVISWWWNYNEYDECHEWTMSTFFLSSWAKWTDTDDTRNKREREREKKGYNWLWWKDCNDVKVDR